MESSTGLQWPLGEVEDQAGCSVALRAWHLALSAFSAQNRSHLLFRRDVVHEGIGLAGPVAGSSSRLTQNSSVKLLVRECDPENPREK